MKDTNIEFDPTLVRGMSYYTGSIFEIKVADIMEVLVVEEDMMKWYLNMPMYLYLHVDSQSDSNESSCCFWKMDMKFRL